MNDTFNLVRFGLLFKKTLVERAVQIGGAFLLTMLITWIAYSAQIQLGIKWINFQREALSMGLTLGGGYLGGIIFSNFSENAQGYNYLTLPTSSFEKWLNGLTIMTLFTVLFLVFFRILDTIYVTNYHNSLATIEPRLYDQFYKNASVLPFDSHSLIFIYKIYFILTSFMALVSLYFNKNAVVKGTLLFFCLFITSWFGNGIIAKLILGSDFTKASYFYSASKLDYDSFVIMPENWLQIINPFFLIGLPAILWLVALIRLREKEF